MFPFCEMHYFAWWFKNSFDKIFPQTFLLNFIFFIDQCQLSKNIFKLDAVCYA